MLLHEGPDLLALHKPAGLPVFPPHGHPEGPCVLALLLQAAPEQAHHAWPFGFEGGIAHRLDNPTSGQLLVARSPDVLRRLRAAFQRRLLRKRYLFWTRKAPDWAHNRATVPISHDRRRKGRMTVQRGRGTEHRGRWLEAETEFLHLGEIEAEGEALHLWLAEMRSGVMHQVRVHAAFLGIALAGDRHYGGGPLALPRPESVPFCLHHVGALGPGVGAAGAPPPPWWPPLPAGAMDAALDPGPLPAHR